LQYQLYVIGTVYRFGRGEL